MGGLGGGGGRGTGGGGALDHDSMQGIQLLEHPWPNLDDIHVALYLRLRASRLSCTCHKSTLCTSAVRINLLSDFPPGNHQGNLRRSNRIVKVLLGLVELGRVHVGLGIHSV